MPDLTGSLPLSEHDRNCRSRGLGRQRRVERPPREDHIHLLADEFGRKDGQLVVSLSAANLNLDITALDVAHFAEALAQSGETARIRRPTGTEEFDNGVACCARAASGN